MGPLFAVFIFVACVWGVAGWLRVDALKTIDTKENEDA
jgi:hypothetical protein